MAFRLVLVAALTVCAMLAGKSLASVRMKQADAVRILMDDLQLMRSLTLDRLLPVSGALAELKSPLLQKTGEIMRKNANTSLKNAWEEAAKANHESGADESLFSEEDVREVSALFEAIEGLSRRDHEAAYASAIARLGRNEESARKNAREKMKLYASLGALGGLAAGVLLI